MHFRPAMCRKPILATRCCFASPKPSTLGKNPPPVGSLLWPTWPSTLTVTQDALHSLKSPRGTKVQKIHSTPRLPRRPHTIIILGRSSALATLLPSSPSSPTQTGALPLPLPLPLSLPAPLLFSPSRATLLISHLHLPCLFTSALSQVSVHSSRPSPSSPRRRRGMGVWACARVPHAL